MKSQIVLLRYLLIAQLLYILIVYGFLPIINNAIGTEGTVYFIRPISYILDILYIIFFTSKNSRRNVFVISLLFLLIPGTVLGIFSNAVSSRHLTDVLFPLIFLFKINTTIDILSVSEYRVEFLKFVKNLTKASLVSSILMLLLFYSLSFTQQNYLGLTPIIQPYFINSLQNNSLIGTVTGLAIAFFSGKRAIMLGSLVALLLYVIFNVRRVSAKFFLGAGIVIFMVINSLLFLSDSTAFNKLNRTIESLTSDDKEEVSNVFSSRSSEINGIIAEMDFMDYIFGKGIGSTFKFESDKFQLYNKDALGNAHFSPLTLVFKFGIIFAVCFYLMVVFCIAQIRSDDPLVRFSALFVLAVTIEYLFSYGLFIDRFLPMAIAVVLFKKMNQIKRLKTNQ